MLTVTASPQRDCGSRLVDRGLAHQPAGTARDRKDGS